MKFVVNDAQLPALRELQSLLGCTSLKETAILMMSLGELVVRETLKGGQVGIINEKEEIWRPIKHSSLDHIKEILAESNPD